MTRLDDGGFPPFPFKTGRQRPANAIGMAQPWPGIRRYTEMRKSADTDLQIGVDTTSRHADRHRNRTRALGD